MRNFLKKANRGLILGGIVLIGFIIFIIKDTSDFKKNKPLIESAVTDYVNALESCALSVGSDGFEENYTRILTDYWLSGRPKSSFSGLDRDIMESTFKNAAADSQARGTVSSWKARPYDFSVRKSGPDLAAVEFSCSVVFEVQGNPYIVCPCDLYPVDILAGSSEPDLPDGSVRKYNADFDCELSMKKSGGKFRIVRGDIRGWSMKNISQQKED